MILVATTLLMSFISLPPEALRAGGPVHFGQEAVSVPVNRVESCKEALIVLFAFNFTTLIVRQQANFHNWALGANRGGNKM